MIVGGDDDVGILRKWLRQRVQRLGRASHDREVDLVGNQLLDDRVSIVHRQADFKLRMVLAEPRQQPRHEVLGRADHGQIDPSPAQALEPIENVLGILERSQNLASPGQELLAGFGDVKFPADALEQRQARVRLQLLDVHGYARLGEMQQFGRLGE